MQNLTVKEIHNKSNWEKAVLSYNPKSFLQSWNWGETNKLMGDKVLRLGFYENKKLVGVVLLIKQKAKRGPHLLIPGGPLIDWEDVKIVNFVLNVIRKIAIEERVWFIRVRPEIKDTKEWRKRFKSLGFVHSPMHLHAENTIVVDITKSEEEILYSMRKNTRYNIRKSLKMGLTFLSTINPKDSKLLKKLQMETVKRHRFVGFPEKLFKAQLSTFAADDQGKMYICKLKEELLAAAIILFYGDFAYYHHSGSISEHKDIPFSYFLQWKIILEAKKRGVKYYNLWGVAPDDKPNHRFAGVTIFKKGFGGERIDWLPAHDLPVNRFYWTTFVFETVRKKKRNL